MSYDLILRTSSTFGPLEYERLKCNVYDKLTGIEVHFMDEEVMANRQALISQLDDDSDNLRDLENATTSVYDIAKICLSSNDEKQVAKLWPLIVNIARREDLIIYDTSAGQAVNIVDPGTAPPGFKQHNKTRQRSIRGAVFYVVCSLGTMAYALLQAHKQPPLAIALWFALALLYLFWAFKEVRES
ncbi:MAG: hypothetical protein K2Z81_25775 [Cyanobacteria bacterium]|nr:hypothetical protein [Cyanobacteriota bacterium]